MGQARLVGQVTSPSPTTRDANASIQRLSRGFAGPRLLDSEPRNRRRPHALRYSYSRKRVKIMEMRLIYIIRCQITNKVYIGQTKNIKSRKSSHLNRAKSGLNRPLYSAIRKYGEENFFFEILEECDDLIVDEREIFWINQFDSKNPEKGFNLASGGQSCFGHSDETKRKISESKKGQLRSKESIEKWKTSISQRDPTEKEIEFRSKFGSFWKGRKRPKRQLTEKELAARKANWKKGNEIRWKNSSDSDQILQTTSDQHLKSL